MAITPHYCTVDDVNGYVSQAPFSATSKPSASVVEEMIEVVANEMDAKLANNGYATPITGTKSLMWAKETCRCGAIGLALDARSTSVVTAVSASGREGKNVWTQRYEQRMKALWSTCEPDELSDAPRTNQQVEKQGENILRSSVQGVDSDDWLTPTVTRDQTL